MRFVGIGLFLMAAFLPVLTSAQDQSAPVRVPLSEWSRQWLEEVVVYIISPAEKTAFLMLANEIERGQFIENFWKKRDPDPATPQNEIKDMYYRRIALANKFFGTGGIAGWRTERGRTYILLGPPQQIQKDFNAQDSAGGTNVEKETWQYWGLPNPKLPYNVEFAFVDRLGTGHFVLDRSSLNTAGSSSGDLTGLTAQFDRMEIYAEAQRNPSEYLPKVKPSVTTDVSTELLPFQFRLYAFKGAGGKVHVPLVIDVPYASLPTKTIEGKEYASLNLLVEVDDSHGKALSQKNRTVNFRLEPGQKNDPAGESLQIQSALELDPGDYEIQLVLLDNFSGKLGTRRRVYTAPGFNAPGPALSDLVLSVKAPAERIDLPGAQSPAAPDTNLPSIVKRNFQNGEELEVELELYHLATDAGRDRPSARVEFAVLQNGRVLATIPALEPDTGGRPECRIRNSFKLKNFQPGQYILQAKVIDVATSKTAVKETTFMVVN